MQIKVGQIAEGTITGIQPYGAFVSLSDGTSGLIHISEISEGFVRDVGKYFSINEQVRVKVIDFDQDTHQARLSLKAVNPSVRKERSSRKGSRLPDMKLGFQSIEDAMGEWIEKASKEKQL